MAADLKRALPEAGALVQEKDFEVLSRRSFLLA
jgi:hypothetical protein